MRKTKIQDPIDSTVQVAHINRRSAVITAGCGVVVALIGAFGAYLAGVKQSADTAAPATVTVVKTVTVTGSTTASSSNSGVAQASGAVSAQVKLDAGTGVDLDAAEPRAVQASGPNGDLDLYFSEQGLTATHSALFYYYGKETDAKVGCPKTVANDKPIAGLVIPSVSGQFCLRTSKGAIGWFNGNDLKMAGGPTDYLVINYQLFG